MCKANEIVEALPSSDGLPEGFLDQRFERWVVRCHDDDSALQRASACFSVLRIDASGIAVNASR